MNILLTLDFPPETGGIQRYLHDIVMHTFSEKDLVLTGTGGSSRYTGDAGYPCRVRRISFPGERWNKKIILLPALWHLVRCLAGRKTDIILAGNIYAALAPWLLSLVLPVRYQVFCYGTELLPFKRQSMRTRLWRAVLGRAEMAYYLTGTTRQLLSHGYHCVRSTQRVPKIDLPPFSLSEKEGGKEQVRLLSVGRLVPHKGHKQLIDAVAGLAADTSWHLDIVGTGPEEGRLREQVAIRSLENRVAIRTDVSDKELSLLYRKADIFILPSIATRTGIEGFGIVLLEAMAYGAAIVASRSGGIEEVVDGNEAYAKLVSPGDVQALSEAIKALTCNEKMRMRMIHEARVFLENRYVW